MTNKKIRLGMFVVTLVLGMITAEYINAQENRVDAVLNGIWLNVEDEDIELEFNNGNFDLSDERNTAYSGTYTTSGNKLTLQVTHVRGVFFGLDDKLYAKDQLMVAISEDFELNQNKFYPENWIETFKSDIESFLSPEAYAYSVTGDTLFLIVDEHTEKYTRKK